MAGHAPDDTSVPAAASGLQAPSRGVINDRGTSADGDDWWRNARRDTPGCAHVVHLNNAGASLPPRPVTEAVHRYLEDESLLGGYEAVERHEADVQRPYTALAQLLHCSPDEIAIVSSATAAWQQVFYGMQLQAGDVIITSVAEYGSNYIAYLQAAKRNGAVIQTVPETEAGDICISSLRCMLDVQPRPRLVSISHVPTSSGRVYDAAAVGAACAEAGVPFLLDACQSAGQIPLDVQQLRCDFLTGTSRKYLRGPRGAGFLYARRPAQDWWEPATLDNVGATWVTQAAPQPQLKQAGTQPQALQQQAQHGGAAARGQRPAAEGVAAEALVAVGAGAADGGGRLDGVGSGYRLASGAKRYEQYEMSFAAKVGLGVAVDYLLQLGPQRCWRRIATLAVLLRQQLAALPGVQVLDRGAALCGIVSFTVNGVSAHDARRLLAAPCGASQRPVNVSVSSAPSTPLDYSCRGLLHTLRASVHYYNDESDLEALVAAVARLGVPAAGGAALP